jgi:hypothetical protein
MSAFYTELDEIRQRSNQLSRISRKIMADLDIAQTIDGRSFIPVELPDHCDEFRAVRGALLELIRPEG